MAIITKLEGSVTDENLMKLGELKIHIKASDNFGFGYQLNANANYTARIVGNGNFFTDSSFSQSAGKTITKNSLPNYVSAGEYDVILTGKYSVYTLLFNSERNSGTIVDLEDFSYSPHFASLTLKYCSVKNFEKLNFENVLSLETSHNGLEFDVGLLENTSGFSNLSLHDDVGITGSITALGKNTSATNLSVYNTSVTGTYANLGDALFANGKRSGDVDIYDKTTYKKLRFGSSGWTVV